MRRAEQRRLRCRRTRQQYWQMARLRRGSQEMRLHRNGQAMQHLWERQQVMHSRGRHRTAEQDRMPLRERVHSREVCLQAMPMP